MGKETAPSRLVGSAIETTRFVEMGSADGAVRSVTSMVPPPLRSQSPPLPPPKPWYKVEPQGGGGGRRRALFSAPHGVRGVYGPFWARASKIVWGARYAAVSLGSDLRGALTSGNYRK